MKHSPTTCPICQSWRARVAAGEVISTDEDDHMNDPGMVIRCDTPVCQHPATHLAITVYAGREQQTHMCEKHTATFRTNIGSVQWPPDLRMVMIVSLADIFTPDTVNAAATADAPAN